MGVCDEKRVGAFKTEAEESTMLKPLPGNDKCRQKILYVLYLQ
jgi:hypothetical protein